jgi:hypothetical protein
MPAALDHSPASGFQRVIWGMCCLAGGVALCAAATAAANMSRSLAPPWNQTWVLLPPLAAPTAAPCTMVSRSPGLQHAMAAGQQPAASQHKLICSGCTCISAMHAPYALSSCLRRMAATGCTLPLSSE